MDETYSDVFLATPKLDQAPLGQDRIPWFRKFRGQCSYFYNDGSAVIAGNDSDWLFSGPGRNRSPEGSRLRLPCIAQDVDDILIVPGVHGIVGGIGVHNYAIGCRWAAEYLPVTKCSSCRSMSVSNVEAPNRNSSGSSHWRPNSSFIRISQANASLALRMPPAGLKPTLSSLRS